MRCNRYDGDTENFEHHFSGRSAVRLAYLVWDQGVAGSNPAAPTREKPGDEVFRLLYCGAIETCFQKGHNTEVDIKC